MIAIADFVMFAIALALAIPCLVFFVECVVGAVARDGRPETSGDPAARPRIAVLMPAHDERAVIAETIAGVAPQLQSNDVLLVVADNCSDDTAALARSAGATVIERSDPERRGKGYALAFGLEHLASAPPDVVVIVDADCAVATGGIERLACLAKRTDRPVQADYLLQPPANPNGVTVVSALAFIVKNRVRPRGLHALGLPCLLTGTGMAFPWQVIRKAPPTEGNLVEDMMMGLDLAELGHAPRLCPEVFVTSVLPERLKAASAQRRRWEHGHLATLLRHGPRLIARGLRRGSVELLALGLDLMVPPLALLVLLVGFALCLSALAAWLGASALPALILLASFAMISTGVLVAWFAYGRATLRARHLLAIPLYAAWKVPLYLSFLLRGRHAKWERTERRAGDSKQES
jgi:cellulose synthase/poly-beta-1,6-N-acetylglucosamine synthase-like glycosyltransferase